MARLSTGGKVRACFIPALAVSMFFFTPSGHGQNHSPPVIPQADSNVPHRADPELLGRIALYEARQMWGKSVAAGPAVACSGADGKLLVYMYPFKLRASEFPGFDEIASELAAARREEYELQKDFESGALLKRIAAELEKELKQGGSKKDSPPLNRVPIKRPDGSISETAIHMKYRQLLLAARKKSLGVGRYGTVVVSVRTDRHPVPLLLDSLPAYYYAGHPALVRAIETLKSPEVGLKRYYFLGHDGEYFEFSSGADSVVINALSPNLETYRDIKSVPSQAQTVMKSGKLKRQPAEKISALVEDEWKRLTQEAGKMDMDEP